MKTKINGIVITVILLLFYVTNVFAGLDWSAGSLTNPDNLYRAPQAIAYAANGNIFVAGYEENTSGHKLIVTKKYSATGTLLNIATNSYFIPAGTIVSDYVTGISIDYAGNVIVLGAQFTSSNRGEDVVIIKYNSSLVLQWKKYFYNPAYPLSNFNDTPVKLIVDGNNNILVSANWYNPAVVDQSEIAVRRYGTSGIEIFTTEITEPAGYTFSNANDMSMDNSNYVTICAQANNSAGYKYIMYSRINSSGVMQWLNFYPISSYYNYIAQSEIENVSNGEFYIAGVLRRLVNGNTFYMRFFTARFASNGTLMWERFTPLLTNYAQDIAVRADASGNIYSSAQLYGSSGAGPINYRMYKYNSTGALMWSHVSSETTTQHLTFEVHSSTALFATFYDHQADCHKLKKYDAATGNVIWTESAVIPVPPGYSTAGVSQGKIPVAVNSATSETALCMTLYGNTNPPVINSEHRWHIRKYGATSPRLAFQEVPMKNAVPGFNVLVFPNPVQNELTVDSEHLAAGDEIKIMDVNGKIVNHSFVENNSVQQKISVNDLQNGIYFVKISTSQCKEGCSGNSPIKETTQKIIVQH